MIRFTKNTHSSAKVLPKTSIIQAVSASRFNISENKNTVNNIFTVIFGFQPKVRYYPLAPAREGESTAYGREIRRIVLLNPTCREMFEKNSDGMTVPTGSGARFCGYTVYTGSGFLGALEREGAKKPTTKE